MSSNNENHKKMFTILQAAINDKKLLMAVMFQAMADDPGKIAGAYDKVVASRRPAEVQPAEYKCPECKKTVSALGIGGACGICDPRGLDVSFD